MLGGPDEVVVVVDQSGDDRLTAEIDHGGVRTGSCPDVGVRPDGRNPLTVDGHRLPHRELIVDRDDFPVYQDAGAIRRPDAGCGHWDKSSSSFAGASWPKNLSSCSTAATSAAASCWISRSRSDSGPTVRTSETFRRVRKGSKNRAMIPMAGS